MPSCPYGAKCYRKNKDHLAEFHSEKLAGGNENAKDEPKARKGKITKFFEKKTKENEPVADVGNPRVSRKRTPPVPVEEKPEQPIKKRSKTLCTYHTTTDDMSEFWAHAKHMNTTDPLAAFSSLHNARLVGVFEQLNGDLNRLAEDDIRCRHRHATDLPEMSTCLIYDKGHYAIWRDVPNSADYLIVHSDNAKHFPTIEVIGDSPWHMLVHLSGKDASSPDSQLSSLLPKGQTVVQLQKQMKAAKAQRAKKKLGKAPSGAGLWVRVVKDVGYREIATEPAKLKRILTSIGTATDDESREKYMRSLMEIVTYVQFANDECDFGMGLELGHWLMLSNYPQLHKMAMKTLTVAYTLLGRDEYVEVVRAHFEKGNQ